MDHVVSFLLVESRTSGAAARRSVMVMLTQVSLRWSGLLEPGQGAAWVVEVGTGSGVEERDSFGTHLAAEAERAAEGIGTDLAEVMGRGRGPLLAFGVGCAVMRKPVSVRQSLMRSGVVGRVPVRDGRCAQGVLDR
jgi:hypothetical protein